MKPPQYSIPKSILAVVLALLPLDSPAQGPYAIWRKAYNGTGNYQDQATAVAVDADGNAIVTGQSDGAGGLREIATVKYSATDGSILWERRHAEPTGLVVTPSFVAVDHSGDVIVAGVGYFPDVYQPYSYIVKYSSSNGALLWEKINTVMFYGLHKGVALDRFGNVIIIGGIGGYFRVAKHAASDGTLVWDSQYKVSDLEGQANSISVDAAGNAIVCGFARNGPPAYDDDYYTAKYAASDGAVLWERRYNGVGFGGDQAVAVAVDSLGNALVTGTSSGEGLAANQEICTLKYAASDGALLWQRRTQNLLQSRPESITVDAAGNVAVIGQLEPRGAGNWIYTAKYYGDSGAFMWEKVYSGPRGFENATSFAMDDSGNVIMASSSEGGGSYNDFYLAKYGTLDGALLSEYRHQANTDGDHEAMPAIALDSSGHVLITGTTILPNNLGEDYLTLKVAMLQSPEIAVQQPEGSNLVDGTAKKTFGRVKIGKSGAGRVFTIENTGTAVLTGIGVSLAGSHARDFVITRPGKTTLAPGASTRFIVSFRPKAKGIRKAMLKIRSNDSNENPFDIQLSGFGAR